MASGAQGNEATVKPVIRPAPLSQTPSTPSPAPIRIPGMDAPVVPSAAPTPAAQPPRAPSMGTIRIPGMDQPAPVASTAPMSKIDFGKPPTVAPVVQEPLASLQERVPPLKPAETRVSEPRVEPASQYRPEPAPAVTTSSPSIAADPTAGPRTTSAPAVEPAAARIANPEATPSGFEFDFGFSEARPASTAADNAPRTGATPSVAPPRDPIADLINSELDGVDARPANDAAPSPEPVNVTPAAPRSLGPAETPRPVTMAPVTPMVRNVSSMQPAPAAKPVMTAMNAGPATRPAPNAPIPLKPVSVTPRPAPETDRFAISPGVGLNGRPSPATPLPTPPAREAEEPVMLDALDDPMSEIENLIGEAVRVELSGPGKVSVAPQPVPQAQMQPPVQVSPVVPPLAANFAPRRSGLKDDHAQSSAEDAILAAAAATGAEVGRIDGTMADERVYKRIKVKAPRSGMSGGMRQYVGMAVAGTLLLAAGFGLYWVLGMGRSGNDTAAPVLTADATPVKEAPAAVAPTTDVVRSPVLDQIDGVKAADGAEQLVSTDQASADVARVVNTEPAADSETGLANRKVRTVTVRPDGTIVSGDEAVAGAEELPIDRPNVPDVPGGTTDDSELMTADASQDAVDPLAATISASDPATMTTPAAPTAVEMTAEISPVIDTTLVAPIPMPRPTDRDALAFAVPAKPKPVTAIVDDAGGALTPDGQIDLLADVKLDPVPPAPVKAKTTSTDAGGATAAAYVQIYSEGSQAEAQNKFASEPIAGAACSTARNWWSSGQTSARRASAGVFACRPRRCRKRPASVPPSRQTAATASPPTASSAVFSAALDIGGGCVKSPFSCDVLVHAPRFSAFARMTSCKS